MHPAPESIWGSFMHSGIPRDNILARGQAYVINIYSLLAFLSLGVFGALHVIAEGHHILGALEFAGAIIMAANILFLRLTHSVALGRAWFLASLIALLMVMLVTGGTQNTGIFWFFMFPVSAFFLASKKQGMWWMGGLFVATLAVLLMAQFAIISIPYTFIEIRQLLVTVVVVAIGIYIYEQSREAFALQTSTTQTALRQEKIRAQTVLQNIDEGVVTTDAQGNVIMLNKAAEAMLGWKWQELVGKKFAETVPLIDERGRLIDVEERPITQALLRHDTITRTSIYVRKDGSSFPAVVIGRPIIVDGEVVGAITAMRDVTQEKAIDRAKSEFVTLASHQLRTPISSIAWASELLLSGDAGKLSEDQRDYTQQIYDSNQRSAAMVDSMLMVSSLELGNLGVRPEPTDLLAVAHRQFQKQVSLLNPLEKKLHATEHYDRSLPKMQLDPLLIKALLHNLLSNAFKYTPNGGSVSITIAPSHEKLTPESKGSVTIAITDSGYGIPAAQQGKIFAKLFRATNVKTKDTDGTGLGLYIVKKMLDQVGGRISFVSHEGEGSVFTVVLPIEGMAATETLQEKATRSSHV